MTARMMTATAALMLTVAGFAATAHAAPCDAAQTAQAQIYADNAARRVMLWPSNDVHGLVATLHECDYDSGTTMARMDINYHEADRQISRTPGVLMVKPDGEAAFMLGILQHEDEITSRFFGHITPLRNLPAEQDYVLGEVRPVYVDNRCREKVSVWLHYRDEEAAWQISGPLEVDPGGRDAFRDAPGQDLRVLGREALYHVESARGVWPGGDMQREVGGRSFDLTRIEAGPDQFNIVLRCD